MKSITKILCLFLMSAFVFTSCVKNSEKPEQAISYEKAKEKQQRYISTRVNPLLALYESTGVKKEADVRDVTFDLEVVQQYINYVKNEAKKKGTNKGLGLRIYLGVQDNDEVTMFFMPTRKKEPVKGANSFFYFDEDEILEDVDGLNYGHSGKPPRDLEE